jgi:hypothetical protein
MNEQELLNSITRELHKLEDILTDLRTDLDWLKHLLYEEGKVPRYGEDAQGSRS